MIHGKDNNTRENDRPTRRQRLRAALKDPDSAFNSNTGKGPKVRALVFAVIFCLFCFYLLRVFDMKDEMGSEKVFNSFYAASEDTIDGIYLGSSGTYRYFMAPRAFSKYGFTVFDLATSSQPIVSQKYIIKEALKTQPNCKVILIEIRNVVKTDDHLYEADLRRVTDAFRQSENRKDLIDDNLAYFKGLGLENFDYDKWDYYFPFLKYHSRWDGDITGTDLLGTREKTSYKGFLPTSKSYYVEKLSDPGEYAGTQSLGEARMETLDDLLDYCDTLDQKVIFVASPYYADQDKQERLNTAVDYIEGRGYEVWDFNHGELKDEIDMNWSRDYFEKNHVNIFGAMKYTDFISEKLKSELNLPDHRTDPDYETWNYSQYRLKREVACKTNRKYMKLVKKYEEATDSDTKQKYYGEMQALYYQLWEEYTDAHPYQSYKS